MPALNQRFAHLDRAPKRLINGIERGERQLRQCDHFSRRFLNVHHFFNPEVAMLPLDLIGTLVAFCQIKTPATNGQR